MDVKNASLKGTLEEVVKYMTLPLGHQKLIKKNWKKIDIKDLCYLKYFLGIQITHSSKDLFIFKENIF